MTRKRKFCWRVPRFWALSVWDTTLPVVVYLPAAAAAAVAAAVVVAAAAADAAASAPRSAKTALMFY